MSYKKNMSTLVITFTLLSCLPVCERTLVIFKNCTKDTLIIGVSNYDNIDSVHCIMNSCNDLSDNCIDIHEISLWKKRDLMINKEMIIFPDSSCMIDEICLFQNTDTCYFFLIKITDARKKSLKQIHDDNLYNRWYTTKKNNYKYDREIRYK